MSAGQNPFSPKIAILEVLILQPQHAQGIREDIERRSSRQLTLGPFRLRLALWSLEREGLLRILMRGSQPYYELTDLGMLLAMAIREAVYRFYLWDLGPAPPGVDADFSLSDDP